MPPSPFHIRDAALADVPAITAIYRPEVEHGLASWEEVPPDEAEIAARMEKMFGLGLPYLVAESDGVVLGYSYAGPFHPRSAYRYTLEDTIYLHPQARGRGLGTILLGALLDRCEAVGCRQMMSLIHWTENSASVALHEKLGFRTIGHAHGVGYKFGRWLDLIEMQKPLGGGNTTPPDRAAIGRKLFTEGVS
jgi:phosphinothricin acetyltransferase